MMTRKDLILPQNTLHTRARYKVIALTCDPFLKPAPKDSCLKCTPTTQESLGWFLETPIYNTLEIHSLFIQNQDYSFDFQQDPTKNSSI